MIKTVTDENFEQIISKGIVLIDFWASWCGPCRMLGPTIDEIAEERADIQVGKLNVDDYPELASKHGVMSIPTLIYFKDGQMIDSSVGVIPKGAILKKLDHL